MAKLTFFPLGNADSCLIDLADSKKLLFDFGDQKDRDDPHDQDLAIKGLRLAREVMRQPALARFVQSEVLPGGKLETDAELFDYACANAKTDHHPVGTCTMGPDSHPASVYTSPSCW